MLASVRTTLLLSLVTVAVGACRTTSAPPELLQARAAYSTARTGAAAQYARAELQLAKDSLDQAEMAYGSAREELVRDRAYVALRRVQIANTQADARQAARRREDALRRIAAAKGIRYEEAEAQLHSTRQNLADSEQRGQMTAAQLQQAMQQGQLTQQQLEQARQQGLITQQQLDEARVKGQQTQQQLETERRARIEAEAKAQQAMDELAKQAQVRRDTRGTVITLSGQVLFVTNQATLLPAAARALDNVANALKATPSDRTIAVEGHSDSTGNRGYNMELSRRRAESVRDYLVSRGVPAAVVSARGIGPDQPLADNKTAEGRANNRRVEIVVSPPPATAGGTGAGSTGSPSAGTAAPSASGTGTVGTTPAR